MEQRPSTGRNKYLRSIQDSSLELAIRRLELYVSDEDSEDDNQILSEALDKFYKEQHRRNFAGCMQQILRTVPLITKKREISFTCCVSEMNAFFDFAVSFAEVRKAADDVLKMVLEDHDNKAESINVNFSRERQIEIGTSNHIVSKELHQRKFSICLDELVTLVQFRKSDKPAYIQQWLRSIRDPNMNSDDDVSQSGPSTLRRRRLSFFNNNLSRYFNSF